MGGLYVVKRDGREEPVAFDKITARIKKLAYGLSQEFCDPVRDSRTRRLNRDGWARDAADDAREAGGWMRDGDTDEGKYASSSRASIRTRRASSRARWVRTTHDASAPVGATASRFEKFKRLGDGWMDFKRERRMGNGKATCGFRGK